MSSAESINRYSGRKQSGYGTVRCNWTLSRYARLKKIVNPNTQGKERWDFYDNNNGDINLTILSCNRIMITQGPRIFENYDLVMCKDSLRAVIQGDSMAFIFKIDNDHKQFRVKFAPKFNKSGAEECLACKNELNKFFPFQNLSELTQSQENASQANSSKTILTEDCTMSDLSKYFLDPSSFSLPFAFKHSPLPTDDLEEIIWLCLSDKHFPAFVSQVGDILKNLADI